MTLSPELVLVDPRVAAAARAALHAPGAFVPAWRDDPRPVVEAPPIRPAVATTRRRGTPTRRQAALAAGCAGVVALGIVTGLGRPLHHTLAGVADVTALRERALDQIYAAHSYEWPKVPGARSYRVELARDGTVVYVSVTRAPRLALPPDLPLAPGSYTWTVTPRFANREARPVVEESFVVKSATSTGVNPG